MTFAGCSTRLDRFALALVLPPTPRRRTPVERILAETDVFTRLDLLRSIDVDEVPWRVIARAPDPGNGTRELALVDLPPGARSPGRFLAVINGTPPRRVHLLPAFAQIDDPIRTAALMYGLDPTEYATCQHRT